MIDERLMYTDEDQSEKTVAARIGHRLRTVDVVLRHVNRCKKRHLFLILRTSNWVKQKCKHSKIIHVHMIYLQQD